MYENCTCSPPQMWCFISFHYFFTSHHGHKHLSANSLPLLVADPNQQVATNPSATVKESDIGIYVANNGGEVTPPSDLLQHNWYRWSCAVHLRGASKVNPFNIKVWFVEALSERNNSTFSVKAAKKSRDIRYNSDSSAPQLQLTNKRCVRQGERRPIATSIYFSWILTSLRATFRGGGVVKRADFWWKRCFYIC